MKPRLLRHTLEKAAKVLVTIQKHTPDVSCIHNPDKGENGHLVIDFTGSGMSRNKMLSLGKDLESKGYRFTEKKSPWLGQVTYTGKSDDKPTVIFSLPITKDRVAINEEMPEQAFSFADSK
ncbi:hypothetical protein [Coraliomargarita akajimensis]|uniref:Uncharacterized protein n=1 Tax=Coraliomargarita akajimensis (strain DSM 45221 / IAM 15411 / JCM 23193 / KCTC 12865 / 04OKA010-24) TaxID=583355 RepID=D5EHM4_CORAD|nr:hypothetical protein [Coraliomargarita akajimensis]ADE54065.1 hypothetical protein Caka_1043 [Coraliomargarita akajimensis DSM 45221]